MALFLLLHLLVLIRLIIQNIAISCNQGPGSQICGPSSDLECIGFEACVGDILQCNNNNNEGCLVTCKNGASSCRQATIDVREANWLTLYCGESTENQIDQCKGLILEAQNIDGPIHITCTGGQHACSNAQIKAFGSNSLSITCDSFESCQAMDIECATDCTIDCKNAQSNVCTGMSITCGTGDCSIDCSNGGQKCYSMGPIDASQAANFQCYGTPSECSSVYANLITAQPTAPATTTANPTFNPSSIPTRSPTGMPTSNATKNPVTSDPTTSVPTTNIPTTVNPTTNIPTTNIPTTNIPTTNIPTTVNPTTVNPTTNIPTTTNPTTFAPTTNVPTTECTADNAATNCESGVCGLDGDSGNGYCCEKEAEVYLISKDVGFQCKIHYCKQDGGDMYVKDDVYSVSTAADVNDAEYVSYLKKACPDISECERANLVFPTVTEENDNCCPTCKGSCSYVTCEEGKECYEGVCVAICIEGKSRNADGECDSGCSWESVIAGSECEAGKECWQEVCVATCDADETRNAESGECECTTTNKESVNGVCVDKCGDGKSRNADGDCVKECTDGGSECNADGNESCVDGICQVACASSNAEGVGEVCTGIGDCVNGVCREACDENETRNNDGECACADGKICDDDQTCDSGVCTEMNVKTGGALNYKLFGLFGFIVVMLSWM